MIIQCSFHYTIMCASSSFNALGIRPRVAIIFSETRSALDSSRSILNEQKVRYRCHKVARERWGSVCPLRVPKGDDIGSVRLGCGDLHSYGPRAPPWSPLGHPRSSIRCLCVLRRRWGGCGAIRMVWSGDFGGGWVSAHDVTTLCLSNHPQLTHPNLCLCNWLSVIRKGFWVEPPSFTTKPQHW